MEFDFKEIRKKYEMMESELTDFSKEEIINYMVMNRLFDELQNTPYWWAVDENGNGHLFDEKPYRDGDKWVSENGFSGYTANLSPVIEKEYTMTWEDEPINITIKY